MNPYETASAEFFFHGGDGITQQMSGRLVVQYDVVSFRLDRNDVCGVNKQDPSCGFNRDSGFTELDLSLGRLAGDFG
jgi:hypothetical protein